MKILLTGGTGFIGRNLAVKLAGMGHHVVCLVRDMERAFWMREHAGLEPIVGDLTRKESLTHHVGNVDAIFHLAGVTKARNRDEYLQINGEGTGNLIDAAVMGGPGVEKVLYVSSLAVAGPHTSKDPATEDGKVTPITHYGESKLLGEELLMDRCGSVPWTIIRPPVVYGPYDRDVFMYFKMAARGLVPVLGKGTMDLSIIHVDDVTEGIILAGFSDKSDGEIFYLSDGRVYTVGDLLTKLTEITGRGRLIHLPPLCGRIAGRIGDILALLSGDAQVINSQKVMEALQDGWVCSSEKIRDRLGFHPTIEIAKGLEWTYRWYRDAGWL
jgi:nucleoside-diphosphate-sugar epimerase